jgi:YHS domain-containing protein
MLRAIFEFLAMLIFFAAARAAISALFRMLGSNIKTTTSASNQPRSGTNESNLQSAGDLKKDPVCGTFVPVATSLKRVVAGEVVYFCSPSCRDQYPAHAK